ncbi:helix-turn-helix domain-containing protein [Streptomyces huiliensis]|uniref:helix-turn-helix domain-containing protein n=1 Tax=Streptomyces huiliensis TaxID=2876027 RepID=UPI001CBFC483|nr:helix-turn-helix transcriptional regulator [Streptomyces huiliensis]MBZ4322038.1 helix-turn-helix transcriptional regulator [Streptomyces huiliensis]
MSDPERLDPSRGVIARYAARLRELRVERGLTRAEVADRVFLSYSAIAKFETGQRFPVEEAAQLLDEVLEADGKLFDLWDDIQESPDTRWAKQHYDYESRTVKFRHYTDFMPALLQTDDYLTALLRRGLPEAGGNLEAKVRYRQKRRALLEGPDQPEFHAVILEAALHWRVGDDRIMRGQLAHLLASARKPRIHLRIVAFDRVPPFDGLTNLTMATIMTLRSGQSIVYQPGIVRGTYISKPSEVAEYVSLYDSLEGWALSPEASTALIQKVLEEKYRA